MPPPPEKMFAHATSGADVARQFEDYKDTLKAAHAEHVPGARAFVPKVGIVKRNPIEDRVADLVKNLGPNLADGVAQQIAEIKAMAGDINKDWTASGVSGLPDGLSVYDLTAPSQKLVPVTTPLINEVPREKGVGQAAHYRQILSWSNSQTGTADQSSFFNSETGTSSWGSVTLRRPPKISYTGNELNVTYMEQGLSDSVTWKAEYAGMGYEDARALSHTALLYATKVAEEKNVLYGRGTTANGFSGPVAAPSAVTAVGAATGGSIGAATYFVKVTALAGGGESVASTEVNTGALTGSTNKITVTVGTEPSGSLGVYNLYVGTSTGTETLQTQFTGNSVVLTSYTAGSVSPPGADSTANAAAYDGFLTVQAGSGTGYLNRVNAALSTTNPGQEFQAAFVGLYSAGTFGGTARLADPEDIWTSANVKKELGDLLKNNASTSAYRLQIMQDEVSGAQLGTVVNGIYNQITDKMVNVRVHPYTYPGTALIRSRTLPSTVPDHPSNTAAIRNVVDYTAYDWQPIQMSWDCSTYMYGSLLHYAPAWSGLLTGIQ
jgi:hypothetical protein